MTGIEPVVFVSSCHWARLPERLAGLEPAIPAWQASTLPLRHRRLVGSQIVNDQEHRVGIEPTSPRYEGGIFAARRPVLS